MDEMDHRVKMDNERAKRIPEDQKIIHCKVCKGTGCEPGQHYYNLAGVWRRCKICNGSGIAKNKKETN